MTMKITGMCVCVGGCERVWGELVSSVFVIFNF
jgi:hypothetical protein